MEARNSMTERYDLDFSKTKECPKCGKMMIQERSNYVLTSNPPQYPWTWWCGCGHTEAGGVEIPKVTSAQEVLRERWERVNGLKEPEKKSPTVRTHKILISFCDVNQKVRPKGIATPRLKAHVRGKRSCGPRCEWSFWTRMVIPCGWHPKGGSGPVWRVEFNRD